jgi:hypothetical protein
MSIEFDSYLKKVMVRESEKKIRIWFVGQSSKVRSRVDLKNFDRVIVRYCLTRTRFANLD